VIDLIPLQLLRAGDSGEVVEITGKPESVHRLEEMGLRSGVAVEVVQGGSPCIVKVAGHSYGLRADDVLQVLVRLRTPA